MRRTVRVAAKGMAHRVALDAMVAGVVVTSVEIDVATLHTADDARDVARAAIQRAMAESSAMTRAAALAVACDGLEVTYVIPDAPSLTLRAGVLAGLVGADTAVLVYRLPSGREGTTTPNKLGKVSIHLGDTTSVVVTPISLDWVYGEPITVTEGTGRG